MAVRESDTCSCNSDRLRQEQLTDSLLHLLKQLTVADAAVQSDSATGRPPQAAEDAK